MGAQAFTRLAKGTSAREVFDMLCEDARYEYGNDSYNGTISTTNLRRVTKVADKYSETSKKKGYKMVEEDDYGQKWECDCLDLGVVEYKVTTVKKVTEHPKKTADYKMMFCVCKAYNNDVIKKCKTKKEADDWAVDYIGKNTNDSLVVRKMYVNVNSGSDITTSFDKTVKTYKSKPNLKPMTGRTVEAVHMYLFYGWAAC